MECPRCGGSHDRAVSYCTDCGLNLGKLRTYLRHWKCPKCGVDVEDDACPECDLDMAGLRRAVLPDVGSADDTAERSDSVGSDADGTSSSTRAETRDRSSTRAETRDRSADAGRARADGPGGAAAGSGDPVSTASGGTTSGRSAERAQSPGRARENDGGRGPAETASAHPTGAPGRQAPAPAGGAATGSERAVRSPPQPPESPGENTTGTQQPPGTPGQNATGTQQPPGTPEQNATQPARPPPPGEQARAEPKSTYREGLSRDEVFCIACGTIINRRAERCPECGTDQVPPGGWDDGGGTGGTGGTVQRYEDEKLAGKSAVGNVLLGFFLPPIAYLNLGKPVWAVVNFFTANFVLVGFLFVPIHAYSIISAARSRLRRAGAI